jgi:hypothetical protein
MDPEQRRVYEGQMRERAAAMHGQPWVTQWLSMGPGPQDMARVVAWLRGRPAGVQATARKFPTYALVRAVPWKNLVAPAPGTVGIVFSYLEGGGVTVLQSPESEVRCACRDDWLELVACMEGLGVADVERMLSPAKGGLGSVPGVRD